LGREEDHSISARRKGVRKGKNGATVLLIARGGKRGKFLGHDRPAKSGELGREQEGRGKSSCSGERGGVLKL